MDDSQSTTSGDTQDARDQGPPVAVQIAGFPGEFTSWGVSLVQQILARAGIQIQPASAEPGAALPGADGPVRLLFESRPGDAAAAPGAPGTLRTIVFLDDPARLVRDLLPGFGDAVAPVRLVTGYLAALASPLSNPGTLLVRRSASLDTAAVSRVVCEYLLGAQLPPCEPLPAASTIETSPQPPVLGGQALTLNRQCLIPLARFVTGEARGPIVWPLACFYSGDHISELAPPLMDAAGSARVLYYGPYFHLPPGHWTVEAQCFFSAELQDTLLAIDAFTDEELGKVSFKPPAAGFFKAVFPIVVSRAEDRIEIRVWVKQGVIEGQVGLRQVILTPLEATDP